MVAPFNTIYMKRLVYLYLLRSFLLILFFLQPFIVRAQFPGETTLYYKGNTWAYVRFYYKNGEARASVSLDVYKGGRMNTLFYKYIQSTNGYLRFQGYTQDNNLYTRMVPWNNMGFIMQRPEYYFKEPEKNERVLAISNDYNILIYEGKTYNRITKSEYDEAQLAIERGKIIIQNGGSSAGAYHGDSPTGAGSSSGSSVYTKCTSCNGTGVCSGCGGTKGHWENTWYYTGNNDRSWINCGSCRGSGRCPICYGRGKL